MSPSPEPFVIAIPIYQGVDLLDVAPPYEIFNWMGESWKERSVEVYLAAERVEPVFTRDRFQLMPQRSFDEFQRVDLVWTPGAGSETIGRQMQDACYLDFLRRAAGGAQWVTSVCVGSILLASAGLLDGYEATSHWAFLPCFDRFPKVTVAPGFPRFVRSGNRVTGGGISSSLDAALELVILIAGEDVARQVQLTTQYFPDPPVTGTITPATGCPLPAADPARRRSVTVL